MAMLIKLLALLSLCYSLSTAVDQNNFKKCEQSSFCRRLRGIQPGETKYELDLNQVQILENAVEVKLFNAAAEFKLILTAIHGDIFRVTIDEINGLYPRYKPQLALNGEPQLSRLSVVEKSADKIVVASGENKAALISKPFKIEFYKNDNLVTIVNGKGLFTFEHYRQKPAEGEDQGDPGAWEENFKSHHDSKPKGPSGIAADFTFPGALKLYGLPEHGDRLALRTTAGNKLEPYRLYNLDVFEYDLDSTMATYGSIPVVHAHSPKHTAAIFWHNVAETWVDIENSDSDTVVSSLVNLVSGSTPDKSANAHFMTESGVMDFFVLMGPTPKDTLKQYVSLTGVHHLPQYSMLAYHQSRWNYNDQDDVTSVVSKFDESNMPVDTIWLDIEYTDSKKYFTWDPVKFSQPETMINNLTASGRQLIVIIDPHIKRESGYFVHEDALANDYYVKNKDGTVYEGWCWPGASSYLDFYDPRVIEYWASLYSPDRFKGTTHGVNLWNDMNEPSVFNGPEVTMPKDCIHYGGWEHRDVHNEYALSNVVATHKGLNDRTPNRRPFILTRGHFAGSQRYTAVWTGDNMAKWDHLAASYYMCLSEAVAGMSFCGADIGGFFQNPNEELLQRWYQAGIWLPFFRAHAHIDTRRREPYLFIDAVKNRIRSALRIRYAFLPLWYTLFWEQETNGEPVISPIFYEYPTEEAGFDVDSGLLVGKSVLAYAISEPGATAVNVYLPGGTTELWYDLDSYQMFRGIGKYKIPVDMDKIVAFYKGGTIVPRKDRPRRSSVVMHNDPFTLYVALNSQKTATGTLYVDDYVSYDYKNKNEYLYINFTFEDNILSSKLIDKTDYPTEEWVERVIILGPPEGVTSAKLQSKSLGSVDLQTSYENEKRILVVRKPGVSIREAFTIKLVF